MAHIRKKKSTETVPEQAQMLDFLDKYFTTVILNMFQEHEEIMSKEIKESMRMMSH